MIGAAMVPDREVTVKIVAPAAVGITTALLSLSSGASWEFPSDIDIR